MRMRGFRAFSGAVAVVLLCFGTQSGMVRAAGIIPVSTAPPGGLSPGEVPQMIVITFDDAVHQPVFDLLEPILGRLHSDGSPVPFTFFVSTNDSDYWLIHRLHAAGHEIAAHTMSHNTGIGTGFETWIREIEGCREALSRFAGIPRDQIRGMRAPFLAHNGPMYEALSALGFAYSSSVLESPGYLSPSPDDSNLIWPYTLHDGLQHEGWTGTGSTESLPDVMEIPMWKLKEGENYHGMDPGGSRESLVAMLKENLTLRYNGNRAPLGIWLHAQTWLNAETAGALNDFLDWALEKEDVRVVSLSTLEKWTRDPVPFSKAVAEGTLRAQTYVPDPESETFFVEFERGPVRSVREQATAYPAPDTVFLRSISTHLPSTRIDITSDWESGFQAAVIVENPESERLPVWTVKIDPGSARITSTWGVGSATEEDGLWTVRPGTGDSALAPGETEILGFVAEGDPASLRVSSGTFSRAGHRIPRLALIPDPTNGRFTLQWDHEAPLYEIQVSTDLSTGGWETVETVYGRSSHPIVLSSKRVFYRVLPVH